MKKTIIISALLFIPALLYWLARRGYDVLYSVVRLPMRKP